MEHYIAQTVFGFWSLAITLDNGITVTSAAKLKTFMPYIVVLGTAKFQK